MSKAISTKELVDALAKKLDITQQESKDTLKAIQLVIYDALNSGMSVTLPDLCKFEVKETKERKVRNPKTGETFMKPAGKKVSVKLVSTIKNLIKE